MAGDSGDAVVRVENIVKDFRPGFGLRRKRVLHGISFEVRRGEIFGFIGPNGAGKTTTLKVLMGLIKATDGSASITRARAKSIFRSSSDRARSIPSMASARSLSSGARCASIQERAASAWRVAIVLISCSISVIATRCLESASSSRATGS